MIGSYVTPRPNPGHRTQGPVERGTIGPPEQEQGVGVESQRCRNLKR